MEINKFARSRIILSVFLVLVFLLISFLGYKYLKRVKPQLVEKYQVMSTSLNSYKERLVRFMPESDVNLGKGAQPVFSILDTVGLHHKNGLSEIYGASIRFRQAGPLEVSHTELQLTHDVAKLFWQPDYSPSVGATHLRVQFKDVVPPHGSVEVSLQTRSGTTYLFKRQFGSAAKEIEPKQLPALIPDELDAVAASATIVELRRSGSLQFVAELPQQLKDELSSASGNQTIVVFGLALNRIGKETVRLKQVALVKDNALPISDTVSIGGSVEGVALAPGQDISLVFENGTIRRQQISTDARFKFEGVPQDALFSLRLNYHGRNYYSVLGRWAAATSDREDVNVSAKPLFSNPEGKSPDGSKAKFITPRRPTNVAAIYESHARQIWPGGSTPQEYDSVTFTNNHGFIDRDRFFDNPDQCVRFVHLGSSHAVALQVRPFEKYNIELESELALNLQKCVEVISAGRDNGDIGANYPRIRDYAVRFKPNAILLENSNSLTMQLHPKLLRLGFGWDHNRNALDNFSYEQGKVAFREWSSDYALHATKPDFTPLQPDVPLMRTLQVPLKRMHPYGVEAFTYMTDILDFLRTTHPDQRFVIHTGLDEAQCIGRCMSKLPGKSEDEVGARTFVKNHRKICVERGLTCIHPTFPEQYESRDTQLTFLFDGHYRIQGHQWLARELAEGWKDLITKPTFKTVAIESRTPNSTPASPSLSIATQTAVQVSTNSTESTTSWKPANIRRLPFPFMHLVTVASDVDLQTPENGAAIHRLMNDNLGLPIANSIWVQGDSTKATSLFSGGLQLNRSPVEGSQHAVFGHVVREWHKGNADSFHSWQDDNVPQLSQAFEPAVKLNQRETKVTLFDIPTNLTGIYYRNLRLHFTGPCPRGLTLRLHDNQGRIYVVSANQVERGQGTILSPDRNTCVTDLLFGGPNSLGVECTRVCFNIALLRRIDLIAPGCEKTCNSSLVQVTRDNFSRLTVKSQMAQVQAFNLRPTFLSSHGGFTFAQNFGWNDESVTVPRSKGSAFESTAVQNQLIPGAAKKSSHAHHADLLQELGVTSIWSYFVSNKKNGRRIMAMDWPLSLDPPSTTHPNFHDIQRTTVSKSIDTNSIDSFLSSMKRYAPRVPVDFLKDVYCTKQCATDQGSMLGLLLELSLSQAKLGGSLEQIWYTHFGSGNPDFKRTETEPLPSTVISRLEMLSDHYYGLTDLGKSHRIWVPPAGVAINYRNMREQVSRWVTVRPDTSEVHIEAWKDSVTGKYIGNGPSALQKLQGLTVYVRDAQAARVIINGTETHFFTRNGPDQTGKQSITLVDSTAPQMLLDSLPMKVSGTLRAVKGNVEDIKLEMPMPTDFLRVSGANGEALAEWLPRHATLSNISHLTFEYRKRSLQDARFFIEIEMASGKKIAAFERGIEQQFPTASRWEMVPAPRGDAWTSVVVPVTQLQWPIGTNVKTPPLPLGKVKAVRFGLLGSTQSASAEVRNLAGLRPSSNAFALDGSKLIGGQVIGHDGKPAQSQIIRFHSADALQKETITDANGYYYFFSQVPGTLSSLTAGSSQCEPVRASHFIIRQDDPTWDFDLRNCKGRRMELQP